MVCLYFALVKLQASATLIKEKSSLFLSCSSLSLKWIIYSKCHVHSFRLRASTRAKMRVRFVGMFWQLSVSVIIQKQVFRRLCCGIALGTTYLEQFRI